MTYFPYMVFARERAHAARHNLTQSGLTPPVGAGLHLPSSEIDAAFAGLEALPAFEASVAASLGVDPRRVVATLGATGGMHLAAWACFAPGSRVASETPSYEPVRALPAAFGAETVLVEREPAAGWRLDPARVRRALQGARPGHVFLTNSHNPTGALLTGAEIALLAREAERAGGVLVCCEVYLEFAPAAAREHAFRAAPNAISIASLTKAYGHGGLRIGWLVLGEGLLHLREKLLDLAYLTYVDLPTLALRAGRIAFERREELRPRIERLVRESRPLLLDWLATTPGVEAVPPALGLTAFPRLAGVQDTRALADHLVRAFDVGVVPGEFFGRPGHVRLGFGQEPEALRLALSRLGEGLADHARRG
jgi:aspartate/methionine/tyrosine aminotransferase